jgi:hypothetical protein
VKWFQQCAEFLFQLHCISLFTCVQKKFHINISARKSINLLLLSEIVLHKKDNTFLQPKIAYCDKYIYVYIQKTSQPKTNTDKIWFTENLLFSLSSLNDGSISISELPSSLSFPSHLWQAKTYCSPLDGMSIRTSSRNQLANGLELSWPILIFFIWKVT